MIFRCLLIAALILLTLSFAADAQQTGRVPHVGVLNPGSSGEAPAVQRLPFEKGLRELGWVPDSNIVIEYRYGEGDIARLAALAAELVRQGADVIVARGNAAIRVAQQSTNTIPIVMSVAGDPVESGFVKSLAHPGGNITGISSMGWEVDGKRLQLLKEAFPGLARVAVLDNPNMESGLRGNELAAAHAIALVASARSLGLQLQIFEVTQRADIEGTFAAIGKARMDAVFVKADTQVLEPNRQQVVALAAKYRLPATYPWHFYTEIGGLMSYAASIPGFHYRSATYVDRILRGAKPDTLPVEQPTKLDLVVNVKAASAIGWTVSPSVLLRADQVIR